MYRDKKEGSATAAGSADAGELSPSPKRRGGVVSGEAQINFVLSASPVRDAEGVLEIVLESPRSLTRFVACDKSSPQIVHEPAQSKVFRFDADHYNSPSHNANRNHTNIDNNNNNNDEGDDAFERNHDVIVHGNSPSPTPEHDDAISDATSTTTMTTALPSFSRLNSLMRHQNQNGNIHSKDNNRGLSVHSDGVVMVSVERNDSDEERE